MLRCLNLLLCDDDRLACRGLARVLEAHGARVSTCECRASAMALARQARPDAALLDVFLGDDLGTALAVELAAIHPGLPILLMTGAPSQVDPAEWQDLPGVLALLVKPVSARTIVASLRAHLGGARPPG